MNEAMMKFTLLCILLSTCFGSAWAASQVGKLYCLKDGTAYTMRLIVYHKTDPLTTMFSEDKDGVKDSTCDTTSGYITHDTTDNFYKVEVRYTGPIRTSTSGCGAEQLTAGLSKYTWRFKTRSKSGPTYSNIVFGSDMDYTATCDFDTLSENLVVDRTVDVTGTTLAALSSLSENVDFEVRLASDDSTLTTVALGNQIYLYLKLTPVTDGATGVYAHSCRSCDKADCTGVAPYLLTNVEGCYETATHLGTAGAASFQGTDGLMSRTAAFDNFVFNGGLTDVFFICKIGFCYGTTLDPCKDYCLSNARRRKRDVNGRVRREDEDKNNTIALKMSVDLHDSRPTRRYTPSLSDGTMCTTRLVFIATAITIASLLGISILVATTIFCRLRRARTATKN